MKIITQLVCSSFYCFASFANPKIVTVATGAYPPYTGKVISPEKTCALYILDTSLKSQGFEMQYHFMPWKRAYKSAKDGKFTLTAYWLDTEERRNDFIFSKNIVATEDYYFVHSKENPLHWKEFSDLTGKRIVINRGWTYTKEFYDNAKKHNVLLREVNQQTQNLRMVLLKRADATILTKPGFQSYLDKLKPSERKGLILVPKLVTRNTGHILFSKNIKNGNEIRDAFDKGYEKMKNDTLFKAAMKTCGI